MMSPSFLQSSEWEEFERSLGRAARRIGGVLVVRRILPVGLHYWYCPRPPRLTRDFFAAARKIAEQEGSVFLRIDPTEEIAAPRQTEARAGGAIRPARAVQPRETIVMDLVPPEENLLKSMHEKTRYNIRLAERKGVMVRPAYPPEYEIFWRLLRETGARDGFRTHPKAYYEKMLAVSSDRFSNELFFAEYRGEVIAAAIINFYQTSQTATYLHGASARSHREVMAPHILQWRIIQEAKKRGYMRYDFWGIDERRWAGVTRFKRGFGGREAIYPQSADIVYRPVVYHLYQIAKKINA